MFSSFEASQIFYLFCIREKQLYLFLNPLECYCRFHEFYEDCCEKCFGWQIAVSSAIQLKHIMSQKENIVQSLSQYNASMNEL